MKACAEFDKYKHWLAHRSIRCGVITVIWLEKKVLNVIFWS